MSSNLEFVPPANEVWGKVIFSQASVILLMSGGLPQCMLGYPLPGRTPLPSRPPRQGDTPAKKTPPPPPCQGDPPTKDTPLPRRPPCQGDPPARETPVQRRPPHQGDPPAKETPCQGDPSPPAKEISSCQGYPPLLRKPPCLGDPPPRRPPPGEVEGNQVQAHSQGGN